MKTIFMNVKNGLKATILTTAFIYAGIIQVAAQSTTTSLPKVGTSSVVGKVDNIAIELMVQGPSTETTPLQIACVFEYTEGDITNPPALPAAANGMLHLDEALQGIITDMRKSGKFAGHAFETLLIEPPVGAIAAKKLLLIGLGDRNKFNAAEMKTIGAIGMREALRLGVTSYAHASDLKDAGIDSPTDTVTENVIKGAIEAYRTQTYLKGKNMSSFKPVTKITLLAGQAFFNASGEAAKKAIASINN